MEVCIFRILYNRHRFRSICIMRENPCKVCFLIFLDSGARWYSNILETEELGEGSCLLQRHFRSEIPIGDTSYVRLVDARRTTDSFGVLPYNIVLRIHKYFLPYKLAMIDRPGVFIQIGYEESRQEALLIGNVLLCQLRKLPITYPDDLVLNHFRVMLRSSGGSYIVSRVSLNKRRTYYSPVCIRSVQLVS